MILRKIIKIAATRCHILKLKCTEFNFGWGSDQTPGRGEEGRTREGRGWIIREGRERGRKGKGREGKENGHHPPIIFGLKVAL